MHDVTKPTSCIAKQCARTVMMVRPAIFYANPETISTNAFQNLTEASPSATAAQARVEFDGAVASLRAAGVNVVAVDADVAAETPDAIYPNNWFSTHADGRIVLYPMAAPNRRRERRPELLAGLAHTHGWRNAGTLDLTMLEDRGLIVEGTGSLVFDRVARLAYAAVSPRTHPQAVSAVCQALRYEPIVFHAHDTQGNEIYHTNVMMSVGPSLAVLASCLISPEADRRRVRDALDRTRKTVLDISAEQAAQFAGNVLFLDSDSGPLLAISRRAWASLRTEQRRLVERHANPVICNIDLIEHLGGGGMRCMLAEIFLPAASISAA